MLSDRSLSVCNVGVLWPNGSMNQDETWHASRPWSWPHGIRWGPSPSPKMGQSPQFSAHICCAQMAGWIKVPLGREVGLSSSNVLLDASFPQKGRTPQFSAHVNCGHGRPSQLPLSSSFKYRDNIHVDMYTFYH